jgi:UDP-GlcNAc:undecaprenyl-phosphate GlcNAc-1-phosphate transferase
MYSVAVLGFVSFVLALILTPVCRNLFRRLGVLDQPDGLRKLHASPVPRIGGVPLMAAYIGAFAVLLVSPLAATRLVGTGLPIAWKILPGAALVFAIGLLDDLRGLKPWHKFAGQVVAAAVAIWAGVHVTSVGGVLMPPWLSLPITLVWLVGCSNAFNLIDGVDGLAAGAGFFATVTILLGALLTKNVALSLAMVPLAGALLGFLRYNFNPASIFLGDSGSLTIGFLLGCYGVLWSEKAATILGMTAPLMALALPLLDTAVAIARRFLREQPIMTGDTGHIHHRLLARGMTPRKTALVLYAACGIAASLSLLGSISHGQYMGLVMLVFCAAAWIGVQHLGYVEFGVAGRMFMGGAFRRHLSNELAVRSFDEALTASSTADERWAVICEACRQFGFTHAELHLNGQHFEKALADTNGDPVWNLEIPVDGGQLRLTRRFGESRMPTVLAPIAETLHKHLCGNGAASHTDSDVATSVGSSPAAP